MTPGRWGSVFDPHAGLEELARELAAGDTAKRELAGGMLVLERAGGSITLTRAELEEVQLTPGRAPVLTVHHDPETDAYTIRATRSTP